MSYGPLPRIPNFSNPNVNYTNVPTGLPSTNPKAADNARQIFEQAISFSSFRSAPAAAPIITTQPSSVSVEAGSPFTLSVTATGTGLTYQWRKDNANLPGATSSSYSKTSATTDAGSYSVIVTNLGGNVTSSAATVTVTTPPTPPSTPTPNPPSTPAPTPDTPTTTAGTGGGGGGGGGSPSLVFVGLLSALLALRATLNNRRK